MDNSNQARSAGGGEWLLLAMTTLVALAVCEFGIRYTPLADKMGWTMVPPVAERVRAAELAGRALPRILLVGDSQTEWRDTTGQSYVRVAGQRLTASNTPVQFVNLAQGGTDLDGYFGNILAYSDRLRRRGPK